VSERYDEPNESDLRPADVDFLRQHIAALTEENARLRDTRTAREAAELEPDEEKIWDEAKGDYPESYEKFADPEYAAGWIETLCDDLEAWRRLAINRGRDNARLAATVRELEGRAEDLRGALEDAEKAMNYLGDILNNHDMVEDADIEFTAPLFERVQRTLGREYAPAADEREG
jgi:hypothetical protein